MSLTALGFLPPQPPPAGDDNLANAQAAHATVAGFLNSLAKFIPGDVLTLYLGVLSLLRTGLTTDPATHLPNQPPDWVLHDNTFLWWACIVLIVLYVPFIRYVSAVATNRPWVPPVWPIIAGELSFLIYAAGSDTIAQGTLTTQQNVELGIAVLMISFVLTIVNSALGVAPKQWIRDQQVQ